MEVGTIKLNDIFILALNKVGELQGNRQIENLIIAGINAGYKIISIKNKKTKNITISSELNTPLDLPTDFIEVVLILKEGASGGRLPESDYFINNDIVLVTNPDSIGDLTLYYNYVPVDLIKGTDDNIEPSIQSSYHIALVSYAAYYYYLNKNNLDAAQMCLNEFNALTGLAETTTIDTNKNLK